jgi:3-oxoacyl-[acyl-carrier protein] reductase
MSQTLTGHVAFVTGSSTGLGKGIAMALGQAGAKVALNYYNNQKRGEEALAEFLAAGCEGMLVRGSAVDEADITRMTQEIADTLGPVDILVANATPDQPFSPIEEYSWDFYQQMLDYFVKSPFLLARAVLPGMKEKKWGRFINIGSEVFQTAVPNFSAYVAAKGAQCGWTRSMAKELAPWNITVNLIAPGWIPTERHESDPEQLKADYFAGIPMGRWGTPNDVGQAAAYYASEEAGFVSGQTLCVNGAHTPW